MKIEIIDNVISDIDSYRDEILSNGFSEYDTPAGLFKGVNQRGNDELVEHLKALYPNYKVSLNMVRQSPYGQEEPNFVHHDSDMGEVTCILYLTKNIDKLDGTTLYNEDNTISAIVKARTNRLVIFPSYILHSRNILKNYGEGDDARLIQVCWLVKNNKDYILNDDIKQRKKEKDNKCRV